MVENRLYKKHDRLDKLLRKDFRDFRRSIDSINYKIAQQLFKNLILEDPRDKRLMEQEAKKQWNIANKVKKVEKKQVEKEKEEGEVNLNKYSDTVVSEAVSRMGEISQENIVTTQKTMGKTQHNIEIKYNP